MTVWNRFRSWLRATLRRSRMESEMDAELRFHMERYAEDLVRSGVAEQEAKRRGRRGVGGVDKAKEERREEGGVRFLQTVMPDLRRPAPLPRISPGLPAGGVLS